MPRIPVSVFALLVAALAVGSAGPLRASEVFVAGVLPDRRPEAAPVIRVPTRPQAWYVHAVTGIVPPYPASLFFLDSQGEWFTPFNRPGMPGRYDIRGWHRHP